MSRRTSACGRNGDSGTRACGGGRVAVRMRGLTNYETPRWDDLQTAYLHMCHIHCSSSASCARKGSAMTLLNDSVQGAVQRAIEQGSSRLFKASAALVRNRAIEKLLYRTHGVSPGRRLFTGRAVERLLTRRCRTWCCA